MTVETKLVWQQELPDSPGDWLWLNVWSCGCCIHRSGVATVDDDEQKSDHWLKIKDGLYLTWAGQAAFENQPLDFPTAWAKLELPPADWPNEKYFAEQKRRKEINDENKTV